MEDQLRAARQLKEDITIAELCVRLPNEFRNIISYIKGLAYD
jgi:hypothetical protein